MDSLLDEAFNCEDQLGPMWDFNIIPGADSPKNIEKMKFKVQDVTLPTYKLVAERKLSGEVMWKGIEDLTELTITIRESPDFSTFRFFRDWMDKFYDYDNRVFKTKESTDLYDIQIKFYMSGKVEDTSEYNYASYYLLDKNAVVINPVIDDFTQRFIFYNCRILGIDTISLSYTGEPLTYSITILPESYTIQDS